MADNKEQKDLVEYGLEFYKKIEADLDCSGACWKPLFGVSRNLADGPVTRDCTESVIDDLEALLIPGCVCLLTAFILMCSVCASVPLCTGFDKDEGDDANLDGP